MRIHGFRMALAGVCLLFALHAANAQTKVAWVKSFPSAMEQAKKANRLVMVDFYTDWCGWCKRLDQDTYTDKRVIQLTGQVVPVKVNAEKEGREAAKKYRVEGFPTILFIDKTGEVVGQIVGYMPPEGFSQQMKTIIDAHKELPALEARYKANPNDVEVAAKLAVIYAMRGKGDRAAEILTKAEQNDPENKSGHLTKAYNAVGDHYQSSGKFDKAISLFEKAAKTGKGSYDIAYAHISIAVCYFQWNKPKEAIPSLEALLAMPDAPKEFTDQAKRMLEAAKKAGEQ